MRLTVDSIGPVWLGTPRLKHHKTHVFILKTYLFIVQYLITTTYMREMKRFFTMFLNKINDLRFLDFVFSYKNFKI